MTGALWGLLNLVFQASLMFAISIPIFIWIYKKNFIKAIIPSIIVVVVMLLTASPWLIRSYNSYPDLRVLKSFGTSFTPEYREYYGSIEKAAYYGFVSEKQMDSIFRSDLVNVSETLRFQRSWDGTITGKIDSINTLIKEPIISKREIKQLGIFFFKAWFPTKIVDQSTKVFIRQSPFFATLIIAPIIILSLFAFLGLIKFYTKFFKINIVITTFMPLFFILATEYRRMLPILPFIFLYGMMGIIYFYYKYLKGRNNNFINELFFLKGNS
jgi:hypothetical protein